MRRRTGFVGALALAVAAAAGGVVWSHAAGAGGAREPATLASRGAFTHAQVPSLPAQTARSSVHGSSLDEERGKQKGQVTIGGGDEVIAAVAGSLSPVAVDSTDGSTVVYSAWHQISHPKPSSQTVHGQGLQVGDPIGIPSVRVYSDATGKDKLLETGAYGPALSRSGRLAFVRADATTVRENVDYNGKIVVGDVDGTTFDAWTTESARYFPYAWAGSTLIAYKSMPQSEGADVYAFTGPDQSRLLAPDAFVVALSPDGSRLLATVGRRMVEVIRVSDGAIEASLPLDGGAVAPDSTTTPHALMYGGSWHGNRVVTTSDVGLVVLDVSNGIRIESVLTTPGFPNGLTEPILVDDSHVIAWADIGTRPGPNARDEPAYDNALVECDLGARSCAVGGQAPGRTWTRWVSNPSR